MSSVIPKKINHLGFVVSDLDAALKAWEGLFGVKAKIKENPDLQVRLGSFEIGGISIVLNESTHPESRWAKYLEEHGPGLEHMAFEIEDSQCELHPTSPYQYQGPLLQGSSLPLEPLLGNP